MNSLGKQWPKPCGFPNFGHSCGAHEMLQHDCGAQVVGGAITHQ